ncbi:MAG: hydrogenase iron-sulfur subunit [Peptococcaceae bacterium]|nr:hydrogenase iron-sulfur subunit [Peptococcaceae bacterium]
MLAKGRILVVGGGIAGLTAAERLARAGAGVVLVEKSPYLGGRVARLHRYYPRMCPPRCGLEVLINNIRGFPHVETHLLTEVIDVKKASSGIHTVTLLKKPRRVMDTCTACGLCETACPAEKKTSFCSQAIKAIRGPGDWAHPATFWVDEGMCRGRDCSLCVQACPEQAVDLSQQPEETDLDVQGIIIATGTELYDASLIKEYGYGRLPGVITAMELESFFRPDGPAGGLPVHPATGEPLRRVAFIQCAGSRNANHLPYCSGYCCTVTLKQVEYLHQSLKDVQTWIFYQDIRTPGNREEYYRHVREEYRPVFIRGLPSSIKYRPETGELTVKCVDTLSRKEVRGRFDLVVLATGMAPPALPEFYGIERDGSGFFSGHIPCEPTELRRPGIWAAGSVQSPMDAEESVKSALAAVAQCLVKLRQQPAAFPALDQRKCDRCGRCVKECPYGACIPGSDGYPAADPGDCRGCGICQGGCPLLCINLPGYGSKKIEEVVDKVLTRGGPEMAILLFLCGNDAYPAWNSLIKQQKGKGLEGIMPMVVPCIGAVNAAWVSEALIGGLDGVMLAGCRPDQCHHAAGTSLAATRLDNLKETLTRMRLEPERVSLTQVTIDDSLKLFKEIQNFKSSLEKLGPNPFK